MTALSVEAFGRALVATGDLDPVYLMLEGAQLDRASLQRWCLAYWMFYHPGVASALADIRRGSTFWTTVETHLSGPDKFPRGTERRHFRGKAAAKSVEDLQRRFPIPEKAVDWLDTREHPSRTLPYTAVASRVTQWTGFGPWIAFKVADMLDSVLGVLVDFGDGFPKNIFDAPWKGALWSRVNRLGKIAREPAALDDFVARFGNEEILVKQEFEDLLEIFKGEEIPHRPGTPLRLQEVETILCKWKSHVNGHYPVGKDTSEILHSLHGWGKTADRCFHALRTWRVLGAHEPRDES